MALLWGSGLLKSENRCVFVCGPSLRLVNFSKLLSGWSPFKLPVGNFEDGVGFWIVMDPLGFDLGTRDVSFREFLLGVLGRETHWCFLNEFFRVITLFAFSKKRPKRKESRHKKRGPSRFCASTIHGVWLKIFRT